MKVPIITTHPPTAAAATTTATTATNTIKTTSITASSTATTSSSSSSTERLKRKKSGGALVAMATDRPSATRPPQNPTTPVLPRLRAALRTPLATTTTTTSSSSSSTPSASLHPNVTTRSPKSLARKARAESVASPDSPYHHHQLTPRPYVARPSSAASNRSFAPAIQNGTPSRRSQATAAAAAISTAPMFFHASEAGSPATPSPVTPAYSVAAAASSSGPKFFHADGAPSVMGRDDVGDQHRPPPPRGSTAPNLAPSPSSSTIRTPTHSLPSSRPTSVVGFPASSRPASSSTVGSVRPAAAPTMPPPPPPPPYVNRAHVKFVYANGTEEVLPPRDPSEIGSAATSPQLPSSPFAGPINPHSHSPSPSKVAYPLSPIVPLPGVPSSPPSYFQRHAGPAGSSRRSSVDAKPRHARGLSIGSVVDLPLAIPTNLETDDADDEARHGSGDSGGGCGGGRGSRGRGSSSEDDGGDDDEPEEAPPPPMTAAERIKLMEERSAASRRERKVMDLEISNASLLAINKTLERELRKQSAELRRYKRLARSGRLPTAPSAADRSGPGLPAASADGTSDWEVDGAPGDGDGDGDGDDDTETEKLSEDEDEDEDEDDGDDEDDDESSANDEKHRAADEKRLTVDLAKHQALLDASTKMNKSLRCSLLVTDQLIREGRKALEYRVRPSDVRLGGRVLCDEEDFYESPIESAGISAAEETDAEPYAESELGTETETENETGTEPETEDESGFHQHPGSMPSPPVRHSLV